MTILTTSKKQEEAARDDHGRLLPGHTANPNGRPLKGYSITEAFKSMLETEPAVKASIVQSIKEKALDGDTTAQKLIWNYMDGLPKNSDDDPGGEDNPIHHVHKVVWE